MVVACVTLAEAPYMRKMRVVAPVAGWAAIAVWLANEVQPPIIVPAAGA